ncbi:MAG: GGDEF domain-containing protein [Caldimicrobium sp.]|nr:GGDEF domain-containing protein [Caldimicrobium sp.]MDW8093878.1 GGDEF domain-containing protein [Caldimicrobium sp.]
MKLESIPHNPPIFPMLTFDNGESPGEISKITIKVPPLPYHAKIYEAFTMFMDNENLRTIAVVNDQYRPIGALYRYEFLERVILGRLGYGFSLNSRKVVSEVMEKDIKTIDGRLNLEEAGSIVSTSDRLDPLHDLIVSVDGIYYGILPIQKLLYYLSKKTLDLAKEANPLTGLPGNWSIRREVEARLRQGEVFEVIYLDINDFKPYNDKHGFAMGDAVIQKLGEILKGLKRDFPDMWVGHIGGDDFVIICKGKAEEICQIIIREFERARLSFHKEEDIQKNYYESIDRQGNLKLFNLLTLSCVIIPSSNFSSFGELSSKASEVKLYAKKLAKETGKSAVARDRRAIPKG